MSAADDERSDDDGLDGDVDGGLDDDVDDVTADWPEGGPQEASDLPAEGPGSPASFYARSLGRAVDFALVVMLPIFFGTEEVVDADGDTVVQVNEWVFFGVVIGWYVYETALVAWRGQTIGKMLARTRVVDAATGRRPALARAGMRVIPSVLLLGLGGLQFGGLVVVFLYASALAGGTLRRNVPDRVGRTLVVNA